MFARKSFFKTIITLVLASFLLQEISYAGPIHYSLALNRDLHGPAASEIEDLRESPLVAILKDISISVRGDNDKHIARTAVIDYYLGNFGDGAMADMRLRAALSTCEFTFVSTTSETLNESISKSDKIEYWLQLAKELRAHASDQYDEDKSYGLGVDGKVYEITRTEKANIADSNKILKDLDKEIFSYSQEHWGGKVLSGDEAVEAARWLLNRFCALGNCRDALFKANMPPHMQEVPGIAEELAARLGVDVSPEALIAFMLHDADRFFDGYYVMMKDVPKPGSPAYRNYHKPIRHPGLAADFVIPRLRKLNVDENTIRIVDALIRTHETRIDEGVAERLVEKGKLNKGDEKGIVTASRLLMEADAISLFTPEQLANHHRQYGDEARVTIRQKYSRCSPEGRKLIDEIIETRKGELIAIKDGGRDGEKALAIFYEVITDELRPDAVTGPTQRKLALETPRGMVSCMVDTPDEEKFPGPRPVVLLFHGYSGYKTEEHLEAFAAQRVKEGCVVIRPDFVNGRYEDRPNESTGVLDNYTIDGAVDTAASVVKRIQFLTGGKADLSNVQVSGHSMGGFVATVVASEACSNADSPFAVLKDGLKKGGLVPLSGVISPHEIIRYILRQNEKGGSAKARLSPTWQWDFPSGSSVDEVLGDWRERGAESGVFGGRRCFLVGDDHSWEEQDALYYLKRIPGDIPIAYIVGTEDVVVMCPDEDNATPARITEFMEEVQNEERPGGVVVKVKGIGHKYPKDKLKEIPLLAEEARLAALDGIQVAGNAAENAIAKGYSTSEIGDIEAHILRTGGVVRNNNMDLLELANRECVKIRSRFTGPKNMGTLRATGRFDPDELEALDNKRFKMSLREDLPLFDFCNARVEGRERYYCGSDKALAVNLMRYLCHREQVTDQEDLLLEYILHEALHKTGLSHDKIIILTTKLLHPEIQDPNEVMLKARSSVGCIPLSESLPLGRELRLFIDKDYIASRMASLNNERKSEAFERIQDLEDVEVESLMELVEASARVTLDPTGVEEPAIYTERELGRREEKNAGVGIDDFPMIQIVGAKLRPAIIEEKISEEELRQIEEFKYYDSPYARRCAMGLLERISEARPALISAGRMEAIRLEFMKYDVKEDFMHIAKILKKEARWIEEAVYKVYGEKLSLADLASVEIEHTSGPGKMKRNDAVINMKGVYKVTFGCKDGRKFVLAIPVVKEGKDPFVIVPSDGYVVNLEGKVWEETMPVEPYMVRRDGKLGAQDGNPWNYMFGMRKLEGKWHELNALRDRVVPRLGSIICTKGELANIKTEPDRLVYYPAGSDVAIILSEFVEGQTLQDILDSDEYTDEEKENYLADAILTYMKMWGYTRTHIGDPKPTNIMYSERDRCFVLPDLGIIYRADGLDQVVEEIERDRLYGEHGDVANIIRFHPDHRQPIKREVPPVETHSKILATQEGMDAGVLEVLQTMGTGQNPLLLVGTHPDDVSEGAAGLQQHLVAEGNSDIRWVTLTTGADPTGIRDEQLADPGMDKEEQKIRFREIEEIETAQVLGTKGEDLTFFRFGDGRRDEDFEETMGPKQIFEMVKYMEGMAEGLDGGAPLTVAWCIPEDRHAAHAHTAAFMDEAVSVFSEKTGRSVHTVRFRQFNGEREAENPNLYVLMSEDTARVKDRALACHISQVIRRQYQDRVKDEGTLLDECARKDVENLEEAEKEFSTTFPNHRRAERFRVDRRDPVITSQVGRANLKLIETLEDSLRPFSEEARVSGEPALLRVTVEDLQEMTEEERRNWLVTLNEEENVYIELCSSEAGYDAIPAKDGYDELGLSELWAKSNELPDSLRPENRNMKNTITLVLAQKGMDEDGIRGLIEGNTGLQNPKKRTMPNSILVPVGGIKTGDSMGLVRGTSFGFKLLRVARNPGDKLAVHSARIMYNSLMHTLGLPNIGITDEEIIALAAPLEQNQLVAALKKLTDSIPAEAVELEERLELYRQSRIYLKAA